MRDWLIFALEYDRWANLLWLKALPNLPQEAEMRKILTHVAQADRTWLERLGKTVDRPLCEKPETELPVLTEMLLSVAKQSDLGEVIAYKTSKGIPFQNSVHELLLHVINHGTYHRGQLRGMVDPAHLDRIPDTDLILYIRERSLEK